MTSAISLTTWSSQTRRRSTAVARDARSALRMTTASDGSSLASTTGISGDSTSATRMRLVIGQIERRDQRRGRRLRPDALRDPHHPVGRGRQRENRHAGGGDRTVDDGFSSPVNASTEVCAVSQAEGDGRQTAREVAVVGDDEDGA